MFTINYAGGRDSMNNTNFHNIPKDFKPQQQRECKCECGLEVVAMSIAASLIAVVLIITLVALCYYN